MRAEEVFKKHNIKLEHKNNAVRVACSANSAFKAWEEKKTSSGIYRYLNHGDSDGSNDSTFVGATFEQSEALARGVFDAEPFKAAREKVLNKIKVDTTDALKAPMRRRFLSEHDGELDFDRLYERNPFHATKRENNGAIKAVEVLVHYSFCASVAAETIQKYGALTWSVVDKLERAGIQTELIVQYNAKPIENGAHNILNKKVLVTVKEAGQYLDTLSLARCFTTQFYRRFMWTLSALSAEVIGNQLSRSVGWGVDTYSSAKPGKIELSMDILGQDYQKLESYIKTAIGG